ncbi:MAG: DUF1566 domain-containing protein [Proteobacteria bacterium]|nr:DUF1566 domain-containing protein [Pseudomonadota bacterium]MBU1057649.1 DUF1566 domain-containing protein [Pseudomonadota bacterium]
MRNFNGMLWGVILFLLSPSTHASAISAWPDTGQNSCYNNSTLITCPDNGQPFYGQDGQYLSPQPSYTKLDAAGVALPFSTAIWSMVRDNVTTLIWEMKTDDGSIHDKDVRYYWCDSSSQNPGLCDGVENTESFIHSLNSARFGGYEDWRLPTILELATLLNSASQGPAINTTFFPNTSLPENIFIDYWSGSEETGVSTNAWYVDFANGGAVSSFSKTSALRARAVRGGTAALTPYIDNEDGTVTDTETGLMWQQDPSLTAAGISGLDTLNWQGALYYVAQLNLINFAAHSDWRLPNRNELQSLVDYSRSTPAFNTAFFPTPPLNYPWWSSTTEHGLTGNAWTVDFASGTGFSSAKIYGGNVRAVRTVTLYTLSVTLAGEGSGKITSAPAGISCPNDCSERYDSGTIVSLTATAAPDSLFKGWTGACSGPGICTVSMTQAKAVTANFANTSSANPSLSPLYLLLLVP